MSDPAGDESVRSQLKEYEDSSLHCALGLTLDLGEPGTATVRYSGAAAGFNRGGAVAGGTIATMIDSAVVQAARTRIDPGMLTVTIDLKVNFVAAARQAPVLVHGTIDHLGRTTAVGHARAFDATRKLVAIGIVTVGLRPGRVPERA